MPLEKTTFAIGAVIWAAVVIAVIIFARDLYLAAGLSLAALISLMIVFLQSQGEWEGVVKDIIPEDIEDEDGKKERIDYAIIEQRHGKIVRIQSWGWKKGDRIIKKRGDMHISLKK